jgi:class 3 adenylate cyclase
VEDRPIIQYCKAPDGVSLAYQIIGDGPLTVFWNPQGLFSFDLLADEPGFRRVTKRFGSFSRSLFGDARGVGASGGSPLDGFNEDFTDADITTMLDAVGFEKAVLIGVTIGGPSAIRFCVMHPERVGALVLIETFAHYIREPDYRVGDTPDALESFLALVEQGWGSGISRLVLAPSREGDEAFRQRLARYERLAGTPQEASQVTRLAFQQDVRHLLSSISVPTLVWHRIGDPYIRVEAGRYLASHIPGARYIEAPGTDHTIFLAADVDALVDDIEDFLTGGHQGPEGEVVTATILFTDIVGSTEQAARMGHRAWTTLTDEHDAMVRSSLERHRGREVKTVGDGFLVTFDSAIRALRCAAEIVKGANSLGLELRAGVHVGDIEVRGDDISGVPVSIAKRVCDLASSGEVLASEAVRGLMAGSGIEFTERDEHELKGVPGSWRLYRVVS